MSRKRKPTVPPSLPLPNDTAGWALYRAKLSCRIGKDALNGTAEVPNEVTSSDWVLYQMLCAIEDIAIAMQEARKERR